MTMQIKCDICNFPGNKNRIKQVSFDLRLLGFNETVPTYNAHCKPPTKLTSNLFIQMGTAGL